MRDKNRYSTAFFFQPRFDAVIKPLNKDQVGQPLYREFSWRDYIKGRVTDNYADLGEDDIQISRYKMATT
jgi:isopenicillin N synthase-like dioxygenase